MSSGCRVSDRRRTAALAALAGGAVAAFPASAHAHGPTAPADAWAAWNLDWLLLGYLGLAAALYARGALIRGAPEGSGGALGRAACFAAGLAAVAIAIVSPLDAVGHSLLSAHMAQHALLVAVAAPLIALSRPWPVLARGLPRPSARLGSRLWRPLRRARRRLPVAGWALLVLALHVGAVWLWHTPAVYALALESPALHALSHATLFAAALLFWAVLVAAGRRAGVGRAAGIALAFGAAAGTGILGALLAFAATPLYPEHAAGAAAWDISLIADQQLGGVLMWVPGGTVYLIAVVALLLRLLDDGERGPGAVAASSGKMAGT